MKNDSILIVGAGPAGLMAALSLAKRGIKPRIIDRRSEPISTSNALAIQARTLEIWEEVRIVEEALKEGHRIHGVTLETQDRILGTLRLDDLPTPYPFVLALPQVKTEGLLTRHLSACGVEIERGTALERLDDQGEHVVAVCNGEAQTYDWVIGCDGAKSTVRQQAEIPFTGYELPQHFIMADLRIDWDRESSLGHVFYSAEGPLVFFPLDNEGFGRLIIDVSSNERLKDEAHPRFEDFQELMKQRCRVRARLHEPKWTSSFWIHCRLAEAYQRGRLFLAGDAAHLHSPVGGQGLNIGVQDAYFLAGLLADVAEGRKALSALKDYEKVRRQIGEEIVTRTAMATRIVTSSSKWVQSLRNALIPIALHIEPLRRRAVMKLSQLIYR